MDSPIRTSRPTKGEGTKWDLYNGGTTHRVVLCPTCDKEYSSAFKHNRRMAPVCSDCLSK
ncbi:hypothetical protein H8D30_04095 [bacterium]|nr:hypothetical protein [bacterium]